MAGLLFLSYCVFSNIQSYLITTGKETKMGVRVAIHQEPLIVHHRTKSYESGSDEGSFGRHRGCLARYRRRKGTFTDAATG